MALSCYWQMKNALLKSSKHSINGLHHKCHQTLPQDISNGNLFIDL